MRLSRAVDDNQNLVASFDYAALGHCSAQDVASRGPMALPGLG